MSSLQSRVLVAVIGVPVLVYVVLWAPSAVMMAALCVLAGIGGLELQRCVSGVKQSEMVGISAIFPVFTVAWYYERPEWIALLFVLEVIFFFGYAVVKAGEIRFNQIMAALFGGSFIGYSFAAFLRQSLHWSQLTADNVLSGRGLELLAFHVTGRVCSPKEAGERYLQEEDNEVAHLYIRLFARTCRNWALATLCLGGLWIAGSLAMCNRQIVRSELFAREFVQGVHADLLARVPILLFDDADYGLWGAARAGQRGLYERSTW